jgi:hypothetical protein
MLIAIAALVGVGAQLKPYLALGVVGGNMRFWQDTLVNAASRFITIDIMFVFVVVWWWMLTEARQLRMKGLGWYFAGCLLVAFSATLPLFMLHREIALHRADPIRADNGAGAWGHFSLALVCGVALAYTWRTLALA